MITDYQRYCGAALTHLLDGMETTIHIERAFDDKGGFYIISDKYPLAIKYTKKRRGPWVFTFTDEQQFICGELLEEYGNFTAALVCGIDGVVGIDEKSLNILLNFSLEKSESLTIKRQLGHKYSLTGSRGALKQKISRDSLLTIFKGRLQ